MKHILIAEDESSARLTLSFILKGENYKVTAVPDGLQAYNKIIEGLNDVNDTVDLLISDIQMPNMTGIELVQRLYKEKIEIPTIVITAFGEKSTLIELMRLGCTDYLDKPFEPEEITTKVKEIFKRIEENKNDEEKRNQEKNKEFNLLKEKIDLYKHDFENLKEQVELAVNSYHNLVDIKEGELKINIYYKIESLSNLGGDFIAVANTQKGCNIVVADVAGHDMGASYHTILIKTLFEENLMAGKTSTEFFKSLNYILRENGSNERLVTATFADIDLENMKAEIISAGHPMPILKRYNSFEPEIVNVSGDILGIYENVEYKSVKMNLQKGDRFIFFTDGIINSKKIIGETGKNVKLSINFLIESIRKNHNNCLSDVINKIWDGVNEFSKYKQSDDMTILGIEV